VDADLRGQSKLLACNFAVEIKESNSTQDGKNFTAKARRARGRQQQKVFYFFKIQLVFFAIFAPRFQGWVPACPGQCFTMAIHKKGFQLLDDSCLSVFIRGSIAFSD
jgi:hypothetical protein